jgi:hypothetical protein
MLRGEEVIDICRTYHHVIPIGVVYWLSCTQAVLNHAPPDGLPLQETEVSGPVRKGEVLDI